MGREQLKWRQLKHNQLMIQGPYFSPCSTASKSTKNGIISDFVTASVYSEKTRLKKMIMMMKIIIGRAKRAPHWGVQLRFRVIYYVHVSVMVQKA